MSESIPFEISVAEAWGRRRAEEDVLFLDVREDWEVAACHLNPDLVVPMSELGRRWRHVPPDRPVIVYCHHGIRSLTAVRFLREKGLDGVQSMAGGIEAWSLEIDPDVPRY
ncbi:MAG: rhodanese-like domain-containing protein [Puniceicoccaceae bacterium]